MDTQEHSERIDELLMELTEAQPIRDTHGQSRAYQVALTKLEEARMWMEEAERKRNDKARTATGS